MTSGDERLRGVEGLHICNTSHYLWYCQWIHQKGRDRGEQCAQIRADGDDLYCPRHRAFAAQHGEQAETPKEAKD